MPVAAVHGKSAAVFLGGYDISTWLNDVDTAMARDAAESTGFQSPGGAKTFVEGYRSGTITAAGIWDGSANAIDAIIDANTDDVTNPVLVFPDGGRVSGAACALSSGPITKLERKSPIAGVNIIDFEAISSAETSPLLRGKGQSYVAFAANGNGTVIDFGADGPTNGGGDVIVQIDGTARNAGSVSVVIQLSPDNSTWATVATLACGFGAVAGQAFPQSVTMRRYVRAVVTVTGGATGNYLVTYGVARY